MVISTTKLIAIGITCSKFYIILGNFSEFYSLPLMQFGDWHCEAPVVVEEPINST